MPDLSFNIRTTNDLFNKLLEEYKEFLKNSTSSRHAINCALTAWHLIDWIYHNDHELSKKYSELKEFQQELKSLCPSLQIMHDIANGSKHNSLKWHKPIIKETRLYKGSFSNDFSRDFDISSLDIELTDGTKIYFEDEIKNVVDFWTKYLNKTCS